MTERGWSKMPEDMGGIMPSGFTGWSNLGSAEKQIEAYRGHVYKCVTLIARRAMSIPMRLYKEDGKAGQEIKQHPFLDLLWKPNEFMSGADIKFLTFIHRDLTGKAFWYVLRNSFGRPAEIWPLNPADFSRFIVDADGTRLAGFEFKTSTGKTVTYAPNEIVYFRYPHPRYIMEGASPIQAMAYSYDIDLAFRTWQRNFFQNSARPDVVFETDQPVQEPDAKRLLLAWNAAHQGVDRSWNTAILSNGLKAHVLSLSAADMEFAALAKLTKEDILEAYNVPAGKLGTVEDVNRSSDLGIDITFNSECIYPRLVSYEDQISRDILPAYDSGLYAAHDNCIPRDQDFELRRRESDLRSKMTSINEERQGAGLEPVPWGEKPWINIAEVQYGSPGAQIQDVARNMNRRRIRAKKR